MSRYDTTSLLLVLDDEGKGNDSAYKIIQFNARKNKKFLCVCELSASFSITYVYCTYIPPHCPQKKQNEYDGLITHELRYNYEKRSLYQKMQN